MVLRTALLIVLINMPIISGESAGDKEYSVEDSDEVTISESGEFESFLREDYLLNMPDCIFYGTLITGGSKALSGRIAEMAELGVSGAVWDGVVKCFHSQPLKSQNRPSVEIPYSAGKVHGAVRNWHDNGKLNNIKPYAKGKPHGVEKNYDENGKLRYSITYKNGRIIKKSQR